MATGRGRNLAYLKINLQALQYTKGDLAINVSRDEIDVSDDSTDYSASIPGNYKITISGTVNYQTTLAVNDPAVSALLDAIDTGTLVDLEWAFEIASGEPKYTAKGYPTQFNVSKADPQTISISITVAEEPAKSTQA